MRKFVADANILFSLGKESTKTSEMAKKYSLKIYSPLYTIEELKKHSKEIEDKTKIKFEEFYNSIEKKIILIKTNDIKEEIKKCSKALSDPDYIIYIALSNKLNLPIWLNDKDFKEQYQRLVLNTEEMIELLED